MRGNIDGTDRLIRVVASAILVSVVARWFQGKWEHRVTLAGAAALLVTGALGWCPIRATFGADSPTGGRREPEARADEPP